jgi:hypothetical protein
VDQSQRTELQHPNAITPVFDEDGNFFTCFDSVSVLELIRNSKMGVGTGSFFKNLLSNSATNCTHAL